MKKIIDCRSCGQKLRVQSSNYSSARFSVTCPKCKNSWVQDMNFQAAENVFSEPTTTSKNMNGNQEKIIKEISETINKIRSYTPKVGVFGNSGVGKSSLCNALFGREVAKISDVEACTRKPQEIFIGNSQGQGGLTLVDVPGIGENPGRQKEYTQLYKSLAPELDLVLWVIKADDRNYASGLEAYTTVFGGKCSTPVIFVISQTDKTNDLEDWNHEGYIPGGSQINNIALKEHTVSKEFNISTRNIISVAVSKKGRSYNLKPLIDLVVEVLPNEKKYSITREAKHENVSSEARIEAERGIWEFIKNIAGDVWESVKDQVSEKVFETAPKIISAVAGGVKGFLKKLFR